MLLNIGHWSLMAWLYNNLFGCCWQTSSASCVVVSEDLVFCGCADGLIRVFSPSNLQYITTLNRPHRLGVDLTQSGYTCYRYCGVTGVIEQSSDLSLCPLTVFHLPVLVLNTLTHWLWPSTSLPNTWPACTTTTACTCGMLKMWRMQGSCTQPCTTAAVCGAQRSVTWSTTKA